MFRSAHHGTRQQVDPISRLAQGNGERRRTCARGLARRRGQTNRGTCPAYAHGADSAGGGSGGQGLAAAVVRPHRPDPEKPGEGAGPRGWWRTSSSASCRPRREPQRAVRSAAGTLFAEDEADAHRRSRAARHLQSIAEESTGVKITEKEVRYVADLANLKPDRRRKSRVCGPTWTGFSAHMDKLNELDTGGVEPMAQVLYEAGETATLREDKDRAAARQRGGPGQRAAGGRRLFQSPQSDRALSHGHSHPHHRRGPRGPRARAISAPRELAAEALRFAEAENPKTNAYLHFCPERALAAAAPRGRGTRPRRGAGPAGRRAGGGQGRHRHQGRAHHLRLEAAGQLHSALRRHRGRAAGSRPAA